MDSHNATVVGSENANEGALTVLAHVKREATSSNSNEKTSNNHEQTLQAKFFKEITTHMTNATNVHITGTGQVQEQFIHHLKATPQFKNSEMDESTSNKMSDEKLIEYITSRI